MSEKVIVNLQDQNGQVMQERLARVPCKGEFIKLGASRWEVTAVEFNLLSDEPKCFLKFVDIDL